MGFAETPPPNRRIVTRDHAPATTDVHDGDCTMTGTTLLRHDVRPRLPVCSEDSLCVVDAMTGSRAATRSMMADGRIQASFEAVSLTAAGGPAFTSTAPGPVAARPLPRGAIRLRGGVWTASQVLQWIQATAERRQVEAAAFRFGLDQADAADLLAAHAYVWARNMLPLNYRYWHVPATGPVNERVAQAVMRHERTHPGTVVLATRGDADALTALDALVASAVPQMPVTVERTSNVSSTLSADSTRARTLLGIMGSQNWQAHHIIPFAVVAGLDRAVQRAIAASDWRMDSMVNLIALPANLATYLLPPNLTGLPYHSGSHGVRYDVDVQNALRPIAAAAQGMAPNALRTAMEGVDQRFRVELRTNRLYHFRLN